MNLTELGLLGGLFGISIWLLYLNFLILRVTKDIYELTIILKESTIEIHNLTELMVDHLDEIVANTSLPPDLLK